MTPPCPWCGYPWSILRRTWRNRVRHLLVMVLGFSARDLTWERRCTLCFRRFWQIPKGIWVVAR